MPVFLGAVEEVLVDAELRLEAGRLQRRFRHESADQPRLHPLDATRGRPAFRRASSLRRRDRARSAGRACGRRSASPCTAPPSRRGIVTSSRSASSMSTLDAANACSIALQRVVVRREHVQRAQQIGGRRPRPSTVHMKCFCRRSAPKAGAAQGQQQCRKIDAGSTRAVAGARMAAMGPGQVSFSKP